MDDARDKKEKEPEKAKSEELGYRRKRSAITANSSLSSHVFLKQSKILSLLLDNFKIQCIIYGICRNIF